MTNHVEEGIFVTPEMERAGIIALEREWHDIEWGMCPVSEAIIAKVYIAMESVRSHQSASQHEDRH